MILNYLATPSRCIVIRFFDFMNETSSHHYFCPLLNEEISEGLCYDINVQRKGYFKVNELKEVIAKTNNTLPEIAVICEACTHYPLEKI